MCVIICCVEIGMCFVVIFVDGKWSVRWILYYW